MDRKFLRILDANFNRSREGLRVCEDIQRFVVGSGGSAAALKGIRHDVTSVLKSFSRKGLLGSRDTQNDAGMGFSALEKRRSGWADLYAANIQRSKESLRVLEEILKLDSPDKAKKLKALRFRLYEREKKDLSRF